MVDINKLIEVATYLGAQDVIMDLQDIDVRNNQKDAELIFPLVGEFSAGKTTLINALTDSKKLETATKPTTSTIYEIHFGAESNYAIVEDEDGSKHRVDEIADLKNDQLEDSSIVRVYDTSNIIPSTTILVDTPGLSSPNPKHVQTLVDFLPYADGILMVVDINQQITRSLTDFISKMQLSGRPIYLIVTKCETKSQGAREEVKKYIADNCKIPISQMVCVAAKQGDFSELVSLMQQIQKDKNEILKRVNDIRLKNIIEQLKRQIDDLLKVPGGVKQLELAIRDVEYELQQINRSIDKLIDDTKEDIKDLERTSTRKFEDIVCRDLEALVSSKNGDYDTSAKNIINTTASLILSEFKDNVRGCIDSRSKRMKLEDDSISLRSLSEIKLDDVSLSGISYNLNLNELGHEYDGAIALGVKVVAVAAVVRAAGAVAESVAAATAGGEAVASSAQAATLMTTINAADTVTDIATMSSNARTIKKIEKYANYAQRADRYMGTVEDVDRRYGEKIGDNRGIVQSMVGLATDSTMGKPQRRRAIHNYIDGTLSPLFKESVSAASDTILYRVKEQLQAEGASVLQQKEDNLKALCEARNAKQEEYDNKINKLKSYKAELETINI